MNVKTGLLGTSTAEDYMSLMEPKLQEADFPSPRLI